MKYGRALDRLRWEIVFADPARGNVYMLKADVSDGFFWIGLRHADAPKRGLIFPIDDVFVDDFLWLAQGLTHRRHYMCRTLFHTLDKVFRPLEKLDPPQRKEVLSHTIT